MGRITPKRFVRACDNSGGIISLIAKKLSCSRQAVYDYIEHNPEMYKYVKDAENIILDIAESKLFSSVQNGEMDDVKWLLARKGKHRGYMERPESQVNISTQGPTEVSFTNKDKLMQYIGKNAK